MTYYSDNAVDIKVAEIFNGYVGHACDVGANDGSFISNTLHMELELGWTVLCVEPNPLLSEAGRSRRKLWREVACAGFDSESENFHSVANHHTFASGSALAVRGGSPADDPSHTIFKVKVRRLDRVLEEAGFPKLDFLTVDVEGWEKEVMSGFTVERWRPKIIVLEAWDDSYNISIPGYDVFERRQYDNLYLRRES